MTKLLTSEANPMAISISESSMVTDFSKLIGCLSSSITTAAITRYFTCASGALS